MINELLVNLVNSVLGTGKRTARGNQAYTCPFCNHHKPKLEVNFTETFDSTTIGNLIGGKGKLKSEIQQQYDKIAARLESRLTGKTKSLTGMNSWKVNYNRNSKGMTSIDGERTSKERNEEWNNPELVRVWMADYNKDSPNQPITEEEVNSGTGENYFRFVKYVAAVDNKLPPKVFESIESAYEGNAVSEIESFRNSSLISFLYNKSLYIDDGTGTMKEVPVSSMQNFGFSRMTENKMIAIERGLLINPNLQEVVDNVKERFDKFNKEGGMTLIEALQNASNNKYSNIGDIDKQIMKSINSTIEQNFLGIGDVSFPTILFSEVKKEIYAGLLEGGIIFNNLSDIIGGTFAKTPFCAMLASDSKSCRALHFRLSICSSTKSGFKPLPSRSCLRRLFISSTP